jgi:hypothetical protein
MHIKIKVPPNQDSATRMALKPVRMQILSLRMVHGGGLMAGLGLRSLETSLRPR